MLKWTYLKCQEAQKGVKTTKQLKQKFLCEHRIFENYFKDITFNERSSKTYRQFHEIKSIK